MKNLNIIESVYDSKIYQSDQEFKIDFLMNTNKDSTWSELENIAKDYNFTDEDFEKIEENKNCYYSGEFWNDTEYLKDYKNNIEINFYFDKDNKEIIINYLLIN